MVVFMCVLMYFMVVNKVFLKEVRVSMVEKYKIFLFYYYKVSLKHLLLNLIKKSILADETM